MRVFVNGEPRELPQGFTVAALVDAAGEPRAARA